MQKSNIKIWELSLLLALCLSLVWGSIGTERQSALEQNIVRFHIIAHDDSDAEQARKMEVKAAVAALLEPLMAGAESAEEAEAILRAHRTEILRCARAAAGGAVGFELGRTNYTARYTQDYALPAGNYLSLRLTLGDGQGHNWWGVIFPQLDVSSPAYEEALEVFSDGQLRLIFDEDGREIRFKFLEILQKLAQKLS